jgi:hypothetical protein
MPQVAKLLIFGTACLLIWADFIFIAWATQLNPLISAPAVLAAAYLSYAVAHWTGLNDESY